MVNKNASMGQRIAFFSSKETTRVRISVDAILCSFHPKPKKASPKSG